jgi:hypothetical protein
MTNVELANLQLNAAALQLNAAVPTHLPPPAQAGAKAAEALALQPLSVDDLKLLKVGAGSQAPAQAVSGGAKQAEVSAGTTWQSAKNIVNQWTINQDRNSWMGVAGIGWQKLSTASDSGCVALTMLASSAIITKASVNYRTESDGMVHEIYVF